MTEARPSSDAHGRWDLLTEIGIQQGTVEWDMLDAGLVRLTDDQVTALRCHVELALFGRSQQRAPDPAADPSDATLGGTRGYGA